MRRVPEYQRVYDDLKNKITDGSYKKGEVIPNESQLEEIYAVSRTTIRKAVSMLVQDGLISVKQGFGTTVLNDKTSQNLNCFNSLTETLKRRGYKVGVRGVYLEEIAADDFLAEQFGCQSGDRLVCIYRIHLANEHPVAIARNYILKELVPGIMEKKDKILSLYKFLKEEYGISYMAATDTISACNADYEEARVLEIEPRDALLTVKRKCYIGDRVCELALVKIIAKLHEFEVYTKGENI